MNWPNSRGNKVLAALFRIGWVVDRQSGSHQTLTRPDWPNYTWSFGDHEEIGRRMLSRISRHTGLTPEDL